MKKFIIILLIFCTVISTFTNIAYANENEITLFNNKPKNDNEKK